MTPPEKKDTRTCDACGTEHESFSGNQAWGRSTFRSPDQKKFVAFYGSVHDGDVLRIATSVAETVKALCDDCVTKMVSEGRLVLEGNYLDDWEGRAVGEEVEA